MDQKERLEFYRSFYDKELEARAELNDAVNVPIIILTGIVGVHAYVFSLDMHWTIRLALICVTFFTGWHIFHAIEDLCASFIMTKGNPSVYNEIADMGRYRKVWEGSETTIRDQSMADNLEKELATCAGENAKLNYKRREHMSNAKRHLFNSWRGTFWFMFVLFATILGNKFREDYTALGVPSIMVDTSAVQTDTLKEIKTQNKMSEEKDSSKTGAEKSESTTPTPQASAIQWPESVHVKNSKHDVDEVKQVNGEIKKAK